MAKKAPTVEEPKRWSLTQADINSITAAEHARGTTRLLPPVEEIPDEFFGPFKGYGAGNVYFRIADSMYVGEEPPMGDIEFKEGFTGEGVERLLTAHLRSVEPEHQHKMAGMAYMIATIMTITE
jgi:hypothetical protein